MNRYHLQAILVHKGQLNGGHYYAFIQPGMDDKWFKFNDNDVTPVTKEMAIKQGCGGDCTSLNFNYKNLQGGVTVSESQTTNNANAYMLLYVRETERAQIMADEADMDQIIPRELQTFFSQEASQRQQID